MSSMQYSTIDVRPAEWHEWFAEPVIDGRGFLEIIGQLNMGLGGLQRPNDLDQSDVFTLPLRSGRHLLAICGCGQAMCDHIHCDMEVTDDSVAWNAYGAGNRVYAIEPVRFQRDAYERACIRFQELKSSKCAG